MGGFDSLKISESITVHVEHIHHFCLFILRPFLHKVSEHNWFSRRQEVRIVNWSVAPPQSQEKPRATFQLVGAAWNNVLLDLVSRVLHCANGLEKDWVIWPQSSGGKKMGLSWRVYCCCCPLRDLSSPTSCVLTFLFSLKAWKTINGRKRRQEKKKQRNLWNSSLFRDAA